MDTLAYDSVLSSLSSLRNTILLNQFFPRSYFSSALNIEKNFESEHEETYVQLRDFTRKYDLTNEKSWASLMGAELDTFLEYDAQSLRNYAHVIGLGTSEADLDPEIAADEKLKDLTETGKKDSSSDDLVVVKREDANSGQSTCSTETTIPKKKMKSKLIMAFGFGSKRDKNKDKAIEDSEIKERTNAILDAHKDVLPKT